MTIGTYLRHYVIILDNHIENCISRYSEEAKLFYKEVAKIAASKDGFDTSKIMFD